MFNLTFFFFQLSRTLHCFKALILLCTVIYFITHMLFIEVKSLTICEVILYLNFPLKNAVSEDNDIQFEKKSLNLSLEAGRGYS